MAVLTVEEVEKDFPGALEKVATGETVLIVLADRPVAELRPAPEESQSLRPFGLCEGEFVVPDDFDDPLPEEILASFEGR